MVSAHLKNISQIGNLPQMGVKIKKYLKPPPRDSLCQLSCCGCGFGSENLTPSFCKAVGNIHTSGTQPLPCPGARKLSQKLTKHIILLMCHTLIFIVFPFQSKWVELVLTCNNPTYTLYIGLVIWIFIVWIARWYGASIVWYSFAIPFDIIWHTI